LPACLLACSSGHSLLVNRGWVTNEWRDKYLSALGEKRGQQGQDVQAADRSEQQQQAQQQQRSWWQWMTGGGGAPAASTAAAAAARPGVVVVEGVVQSSEQGSRFVPPNDPERGQFYSIDVPGMVRRRPGPPPTFKPPPACPVPACPVLKNAAAQRAVSAATAHPAAPPSDPLPIPYPYHTPPPPPRQAAACGLPPTTPLLQVVRKQPLVLPQPTIPFGPDPAPSE
jgi:hypothetical protein